MRTPGVEGGGAPEFDRIAVLRIVVEEAARKALILEIASRHGQHEPIAGGDHDGGGPDLHVQLINLAGRELLDLVMAVPGRHGNERSGSVLRCEARNQPIVSGVHGSCEPMKCASFMSGPNRRSTRNRSASAVSDEFVSRAEAGPVISVSCGKGSDRKVTPGPVAE